MERSPEVTVVIPCRDAATTIGLQLGALARQLDPPAFEVVVVDNGSSDDIDGEVERARRETGLDVRLVRATAYPGSSYARNVGIAHASTSTLLFCDADDVVSRTWVRNGARATEHSPLWSGSAVLLPEEVFDDGLEAVLAAFDADPPDWTPPGEAQPGPFPVLMGCTFGARRETLLALRGFDQAFPHHGDDNDLGSRAHRAGLRIPVVDTVRIGYRGRFSTSDRMRRAFHDARAARRLLVIDHLAPPPWLRPWPLELAACAAATALLPLRRGTTRPSDVLLRWCHAAGDASGALLPHTGRGAVRLPGVGLEDAFSSARGEGR